MSTRKKQSALYTRKGDKGVTGLYDATRISKSSAVVNLLGNIDGVTVQLGKCRTTLTNSRIHIGMWRDELIQQLTTLQQQFIDIGSFIASPIKWHKSSLKEPFSDIVDINDLERWIDEIDARVPKLTQFILPCTTVEDVPFHEGRVGVRALERMMMSFLELPYDERYTEDHRMPDSQFEIKWQIEQDAAIRKYLNRLSDYMFVCARHVSHMVGGTEITYKRSAHKKKC
jgi:cob(I)alamin adenosyltransferase